MKTCPNCDAEVPEELLVCPECGYAFDLEDDEEIEEEGDGECVG